MTTCFPPFFVLFESFDNLNLKCLEAIDNFLVLFSFISNFLTRTYKIIIHI